MHYVYIIKSEKFDKLYIGFSSDLKRRVTEHNMGLSTYTKSFRPWKLVYYEAYASKTDAQSRERQFKKHAKAWGQLKNRIKNSLNEN